MRTEEIEARELDALYDEKRDKLNARLTVWSLLITLFGAVGYASVQPGMAGYLALLYPLLAGTIARFTGHSERTLDRVKRRIYEIEAAAGYQGYEHSNKAKKRGGSGSHLKALRDFIVLTDAVATIAIAARLLTDQQGALALFAALVHQCHWDDLFVSLRSASPSGASSETGQANANARDRRFAR